MRFKDPHTQLEHLIVSFITVVVPVAAGFLAHWTIGDAFDSPMTADITATILALLLFAWLNVERDAIARFVHWFLKKEK